MEATNAALTLSKVIELLEELENDERRRVLQTVQTYYDIALPRSRESSEHFAPVELSRIASPKPGVPFGAPPELSPKEFLLQKRPVTDVQKITCLAYYLATYRETPHFTTRDLSKLNMEAAQPAFANIAYSASNAAKSGYLVPAGKERRQLSAHGEQFVIALPDQASAKAIMMQRKTRPKAIRSVRAAAAKRTKSK